MKRPKPSAQVPSAQTARPWWSFGYVWLILAGPAIVVVAGFWTYYLAARMPDPVLPTHLETAKTQAEQGISQAPAVQARNHAATGQMPALPHPKPVAP